MVAVAVEGGAHIEHAGAGGFVTQDIAHNSRGAQQALVGHNPARAQQRHGRKDHRQAIRLTRNGFTVRENGKLYVAKVGELKVAWSRELPSDPSSVTIVKDSAGRYFASFVVAVGDDPLPVVESEVGIDLGLASFAVLANGRKVDSPRFLRQAERRLKKAQRCLSRKERGRGIE